MHGFEDIGSKGKFLAKNHIMSPQAMYFWPKNGQNSQNKNFPRHNTAIDDSKQLSQVSDHNLDKSDVWIRRKCPKTWFFG